MEKLSKPNYRRIYSDIIMMKFPHKNIECEKILSKKKLSVLDVLKINKILFPVVESQKHRSYDRETILYILAYQQEKKLNNSQLAFFFNLSRNTVTKWKKLQCEKLI